MALFSFDPAPLQTSWNEQWKLWLGNFRNKLVEFLQSPTFTDVTITGDVDIDGNLNVDGTLSFGGVSFNPPVHSATTTASGTEVNFTGIPSWVRKIIVTFNDLSTNGTSGVLIRLGTASGVATTGYDAVVGETTTAATANAIVSTAGFLIQTANAATTERRGTVTFVLHNPATNTWVAGGDVYIENAADDRMINIAGEKSLSGVLDRVQITTVGGVNTFDAGTISIRYEY